ncbi:hypothetical protein G3I30_14990 [Actinospica acidiphila]|uniref:hypothetical protein n=1 Tax=Streptomyces erythrogriseus TaxID=284027 RepID=UPI0013D24496|nr:hypothetical protein [Actinospica acidiphila]
MRWWPQQRTVPAGVGRPVGAKAEACVRSMPSAHPLTPAKLTAMSPDHRSRSGNAVF